MDDPVLGLRFDPQTFGRSTYDCATKWPLGFNPAVYGLLPTQSSCVDRQALDFDGLSMEISEDLDLSGASFRSAKLQVFCSRGSLRNADFTRAQFSGSARHCDLTNALFDHATVSAGLTDATLVGTRFIDTTLDVNAISSFPKSYFWTHKPPPASSRTFTDLPGASFVRSRVVCPSVDPTNKEALAATLRSLQVRGLMIDATCPAP